jgi:hypothetical protein
MSIKTWLARKAITGKLPDWFYGIVGKKISKALKLEDGPMEDNKSWYKSKGVLSGIAIALLGTYDLLRLHVAPQFGWPLPEVPSFVYTLLAAVGIHARVTATAKIG